MADQVTVSGLAKAPWPPAHLPQIVTAYQPKSLILERVKGIEPSSSAWKAVALPLSYTRSLNFKKAWTANAASFA